jgi:hypothetical protein
MDTMTKGFTLRIRKGAAFNDVTARDPVTGQEVTVELNGMKFVERNAMSDMITGSLKPVLAAPRHRRNRKAV